MKTDRIQKAYHDSKDIYNDVLTQKSFLSKMYISLFWGVDDNKIAEQVLSWIPQTFEGILLDVPVGTGIFTKNKYSDLRKSQIIGVDYSQDMINKAEEEFSELKNISLQQGDVGNLNFENNIFDIVLSMNGFHAFPDQKKAFFEIHRIIKPNGRFIACFYIKNEKLITDIIVNSVLKTKGWFAKNQLSKTDVENILKSQYDNVNIYNNKSMIWFYCENKRLTTA